jgi:hypothetical protein
MSTVGAISGTLATIFWFAKLRKWIIREGLNGISISGSGAPMARGLKKSRGLRTAGLLLGYVGKVPGRPCSARAGGGRKPATIHKHEKITFP